MSDDYECCASGSCEVCRRPQGYTPKQREEFRRQAEESYRQGEEDFRWWL